MSNDLQAQVTANADPGVAAINQVTSAMDRLERKTRSANKEAQDLQKKVNSGYKEAGAGVARAGGPLGSIGGRLLGGMGMGGSLGIASAALAVLTTTVTALSAASDRAVAQMGKQIEEENKLREAREKGEKAIAAQAQEGASQAPSLRRLIAVGGQSSYQAVQRIEQAGLQVDTQTAARGIELIQQRFPAEQVDRGAGGQVIAQALELTKVGMKFDEAVEKLIAKGGMGTPETASRSAALVFKEFSGQRGDPEANIQWAKVKIEQSTFLRDVQEADAIKGRRGEIIRGRSGELAQTAREDLAAAIDPVSKAMLDANNIAVRQLDAMERMAREQYTLTRWLRTSGRVFGLSEGSENQKIDDARRAREAALMNADR